MADEPAPAAQQDKEPTIADLKAIADAALKTAQEAKDAASAGTAAQDGAQKEAESRGLSLPPELLQQIGDAMSGQVVEKLRAEFDVGANPPTSAGPETKSDPATSGTATEATANPTTDTTDQPPARKKTLAERFLGE